MLGIRVSYMQRNRRGSIATDQTPNEIQRDDVTSYNGSIKGIVVHYAPSEDALSGIGSGHGFTPNDVSLVNERPINKCC